MLLGVALVLSACAAPQPTVPAERVSEVLTGLDVLRGEGFTRLAGRRVGLVTNHSGIDRTGRHGIDLFRFAPGVDLIALFSPEHGIRGTEDREGLESGVDPSSGLKIHSLYGKTKRPTADMLGGLDTLVFDIQDIGARFYTYIATLGGCMEVAAERGLKVVVLDRPNPLGGRRFDGPIQDADLIGKFTAFRAMPVTHGMTVGEIARLFNTEIGCDLEVVSMLGWRRDLFFDETGLPWVNPSPNMRSLTEELLYPMIALLEANPAISVGRGTDRPFEHVGAPWMDAEALVGNLRARGLGGVWPMRTTFVPAADSSYPHHGETCQGVRFVVTDRRALRPVEAGIHLIAALLDVHGEHFDTRRLRGLVGAQWVLDALNAGEEPSAIAGRWRDSKRFSSFSEARARALLY